jgi:transposase
MVTTPPRPPTGQRRDFQAMERTRLRAARMFEHGTSQAEVARRLHTSRQNAHRWYRKWQHGGRAALRAAGRAGRTPKLDARARHKVERALLQGALAHGFDSDLWTCKRVVIVIERLTGVRHHPSHAWRILRAMGWTCSGRAAPCRARRGRHRPLGQAGLAQDLSKTRAGGARGWSSWMRAGLASPHRCGAPGRRGATPRSCGTASATGRGCRWRRCAATGPAAVALGWRSICSRAATTTSC